jgi:hypothetical protein
MDEGTRTGTPAPYVSRAKPSRPQGIAKFLAAVPEKRERLAQGPGRQIARVDEVRKRASIFGTVGS